MTIKTTLYGGRLDGTVVEIQADSLPKYMVFGEEQYVLVVLDIPYCAQKRTVFLNVPGFDPVNDGKFVAELLERLTGNPSDRSVLVEYQAKLWKLLSPVRSYCCTDEKTDSLWLVEQLVEELQTLSQLHQQGSAEKEAEELHNG